MGYYYLQIHPMALHHRSKNNTNSQVVKKKLILKNQDTFWFKTRRQKFSQKDCFQKMIVQNYIKKMICLYDHTKVNFQDPSSNSENPKIEVKTTIKKTFIHQMATPFGCDHYECFCPKTQLTIVKDGLGNILNKKCVRFSDGAHLKIQQKPYFFPYKNTHKSRKTRHLLFKGALFCFLWKLHLFSRLAPVSQIKQRPTSLE